MSETTQVFHAKWIVTCEENATPLESHALVIQNGYIEDILPSTIAKETYREAQHHHYENHTLMPGFVNAHTHLAMNYFRGLADDLALMDWLNNHIWPAERTWVNHEFVYDASLFAMAEMIRSGATCFNDMYFFLPATAEAATLAGIRGSIGITIIDFPTRWAEHPDEYFSKGLDFLQEYQNHPLIKVTLAPHAPYTVSDEYLVKANELAWQYDLKINMHIHETLDEIKASEAKYKKRPLKRLQELGLVSPRLIAIHMTQINAQDFAILEAERPQIIHCPESNMKLASGIAPVHEFQARGLNVALGTDGAASNNDLDMISEMRTAALLGKLSTQNPTALSASDVLSMATFNGAKALGLEHVTGSLKKGKSADFIALNLEEIETLPLYHPVSQLVYAAGRNQVTDVWVSGKQLMKNRALLTINEEALKEKAQFWQRKICNKVY